MSKDINELSYYPSLVQSSPEQNKRKRKTWKGIVPTRKSARLNKESAPWVSKNKLLDDESYHGDSKDNDSLDNETLEGEILENLVQPLENRSQLVLYRLVKSNNMNLTENKLRLIQKFIEHSGAFYKFSKDPTIAYSLHKIYEFLTVNGLRFSFRTLLNEPILFPSILIDHNKTTHVLNSVEMDHLRPIPTMENHVNFCMLHHDQNSFIPEIIK